MGPVVAVPTALIVCREIAVSALREWMAGRGEREQVAVGFAGKVKTAAQMAALMLLLLAHPGAAQVTAASATEGFRGYRPPCRPAHHVGASTPSMRPCVRYPRLTSCALQQAPTAFAEPCRWCGLLLLDVATLLAMSSGAQYFRAAASTFALPAAGAVSVDIEATAQAECKPAPG